MTVSSTTRKAGPFNGNNVTTAFPFAFKVFAQSDVVVVKTDPNDAETTLTLTTHYTVSLNADQDTSPGGTVTLPSALLTNYKITLTSDVPTLQAVELANLGGFYPAVINAALDRLTIFCQELAEEVNRSVKVPISSTTDPDVLVASVTASETAAAASAAAAAASAAAAAAAIPSGALGYTPVNIIGDTMTGNLVLPGINVGGSGVITSLGSAATKTAGAAAGNVPLWDYVPLNSTATKTGAYTIVSGDRGKLIDATSGTWTLTLTAATTLAAGFSFAVRNSGTGVITIDPNAAEQIDGAATLALAAGESCLVVCDGAAFKTVGKTVGNGAFRSKQIFIASGTWTKPAGLVRAKVTVVGGGGGGGGSGGAGGVGAVGAGGGHAVEWLETAALGATETVTVPAAAAGGGASGGVGSAGATGGTVSLGTLLSATGGGGGGGGSSNTGAAPTATGVGSGGDLNGRGALVGASFLSAAPLTPASGNVAGVDGVLGSGGSGARTDAAGNAAGGAGGVGIVIVEEFF